MGGLGSGSAVRWFESQVTLTTTSASDAAAAIRAPGVIDLTTSLNWAQALLRESIRGTLRRGTRCLRAN